MAFLVPRLLWFRYRSSGVDPVAMARRLTRDKQARRVRTAIENPMTLPGRNLEASAGVKNEAVLLHVNGQLSRENVEELARMEVEMLDLTRARRHELFDDAEIWSPDEMPAVAVLSSRTTPFVMLGGLRADDLCHRDGCCRSSSGLVGASGNVSHSEDMEVLESALENVDQGVISIRIGRPQEEA